MKWQVIKTDENNKPIKWSNGKANIIKLNDKCYMCDLNNGNVYDLFNSTSLSNAKAWIKRNS